MKDFEKELITDSLIPLHIVEYLKEHEKVVLAGTATSIYLNDYPRKEAVGTITQIHYNDSEPISYVIFEESGYLCSMVQPEDIVGIVSNE